MAPKKKKKRKSGGAHPAPGKKSLDPRERGLEFFQKQNYMEAIHQWESLPRENDTALAAALAEAYFRRGLGLAAAGHPSAVEALRQAVKLVPDEARYLYHLALALHSHNQVTEAAALYERLSPHAIPGLAQVRALAALELNPQFDIEKAEWIPTETRAALRPAAALLRGEALPEEVETADFWRGLSALQQDDAGAAKTLLASAADAALHPVAEQIRAFYQGAALAKSGKMYAAVQAWENARQNARKAKIAVLPQLEAAVEQTQSELLYQLKSEERWNDLLREARAALKISPEAKLPLQSLAIALDRSGHAAAAAGQWKEAEVHWQQLATLLEEHPGMGSPLSPLQNSAIINELLEKPAKAAQLWEKVLSSQPKPRGKSAAAKALQTNGNRDRLLWIYRHIIDLYVQVNKPENAIPHYESLLKLAPDDKRSHLEFATILWVNNWGNKAHHELNKILERDPDYVPALLKQVEFELEQLLEYFDEDDDDDLRNLEQMEKTLRRVLSLEPENKVARERLCELLTERGKAAARCEEFAEAREIYQEAHELFPDNIQALTFLLDTEQLMGLTDAAHKHAEKLVATGSPHAYSWLVFDRLRDGDFPGARAVIQRAIDNRHISHDVYGQSGIISLRLGSVEKKPEWVAWAEELLDQAIVDAPTDLEGYSNVIEALGKLEDAAAYELAIKYARRATQSHPKNPNAFVLLALAEFQTKKTEAALKTLDVAEKLALQLGDRDTLGIIDNMRVMFDEPFLGPFAAD